MSVIGGEGDRDETVRALQQAMPFVRHELGRRLRIKRIPELHVKLDDSAERGTRVLHLLNELEGGADPQAIEPFQDTLPTPVRRLPHEGDADDPTDAAPEAVQATGRSGRSRSTGGRSGSPSGGRSSGRGKPGHAGRSGPGRSGSASKGRSHKPRSSR